MKIFYDFEFFEDGRTIEPISMGAISQNGDRIYLINNAFDWNMATDWLIQNVFPNLTNIPCDSDEEKLRHWGDNFHRVSLPYWSKILEAWFTRCTNSEDEKIEMVGYYADYDHVCFSQLWGDVGKLPKRLPFYSTDLKQWLNDLDVDSTQIPFFQPYKQQHNAYYDALWNKDVYTWLTQNYKHPEWSN